MGPKHSKHSEHGHDPRYRHALTENEDEHDEEQDIRRKQMSQSFGHGDRESDPGLYARAQDGSQQMQGSSRSGPRSSTARSSATPNKQSTASGGKKGKSPLSFERGASFVVDEAQNQSKSGRKTVRAASKSPISSSAPRSQGRATVMKSSSTAALSFVGPNQHSKSDKKAKLKKYQQLLDSEKKRQQRAFEKKAGSAKAKGEKAAHARQLNRESAIKFQAKESIRVTVKQEPIMMIPDSLRQSTKNDSVLKGVVQPKKDAKNSPGSQPVTIIFNDKEQSEDNTYNEAKDVRTSVRNDSMLFSSVRGQEAGADASALKSGCLLSLCGSQDKRASLLQGSDENTAGKPKIRNEKQSQRNSQRQLSSEMASPSLFGSLRESKPKQAASCCDLCHLFEPEKCWRKYLMEFLDSKSQFVLCLEQEEAKEQELDFAVDERGDHASSSKHAERKKQTLVTGAGSRTLTWRQQLLGFIKEQPGDYVDQRWQQNYFDEFKILGLETDQSNTSKGGLGRLYDKVGQAMQSASHTSGRRAPRIKPPSSMSLNEVEKMNMKTRQQNANDVGQQSEATGQNALRLSAKFHEKLLFIKKELEHKIKKHPITSIIEHFRNTYSCQYQFLLMRNQKVFLKSYNQDERAYDQDQHMMASDESNRSVLMTKHNVRVLKQEINSFIQCIVTCLLKFYQIKLSQTDIKRDLLVNMITNQIVRDEIYFILFSMYSELNQENINKLTAVQESQAALDKYLSFEALTINKEFHMDPRVRQLYPLKENEVENFEQAQVEEDLKQCMQPYLFVIDKMRSLDDVESPMSKLEHIYKCCTEEIQIALDSFWQYHEIPQKKLQVDVDNLQAIIVYMISRLANFPTILTHLSIIENFLPDAVQLSNRAFYLAMMQSSCEFIVNQYDKMAADAREAVGGETEGRESQALLRKPENKSMSNIERIKQKQNAQRPQGPGSTGTEISPSLPSQRAIRSDLQPSMISQDGMPPEVGSSGKQMKATFLGDAVGANNGILDQAREKQEGEGVERPETIPNTESFAGEDAPNADEEIDTDKLFFDDNQALRDDLMTHNDDHRRRSGAGPLRRSNGLEHGARPAHRSEALGNVHFLAAGRANKRQNPREADDSDLEFEEQPDGQEYHSPPGDPNLAGSSQDAQHDSDDSDGFNFRQQRQRTLTRVPQLSKEERRKRINQLKRKQEPKGDNEDPQRTPRIPSRRTLF